MLKSRLNADNKVNARTKNAKGSSPKQKENSWHKMRLKAQSASPNAKTTMSMQAKHQKRSAKC